MERYEWKLAAACVRGAAARGAAELPPALMEKDLDDLTREEFETILEAGDRAGLRMYHFKKKETLPRVKAVMGFLKAVQPESLLDVGSGRGVFLFPFLGEFPWAAVTSVDILPHRVRMLQDIAQGGMEHLTAMERNLCHWQEGEGLYDVVTLLEVLEHIPDVQQAVCNAVRLARRYVVVSVPSQPDDNPEHIHLLTKEILTELFTSAGCRKLSFGGVNGHLVMMASK